MKTGRVSSIVRITLTVALAGCIDATTVYMLPDPGASGDDGAGRWVTTDRPVTGKGTALLSSTTPRRATRL